MEMVGMPTADGSTHGTSAVGPPNSFRANHCRAPKTMNAVWNAVPAPSMHPCVDTTTPWASATGWREIANHAAHR